MEGVEFVDRLLQFHDVRHTSVLEGIRHMTYMLLDFAVVGVGGSLFRMRHPGRFTSPTNVWVWVSGGGLDQD